MMEILTIVLPPIITSFVTLIGVLLANRKNQAVIEYRLQQLEQKVNKHNNLIDRTYKLEESNQLLWQWREDQKEKINKVEEEIDKLKEDSDY